MKYNVTEWTSSHLNAICSSITAAEDSHELIVFVPAQAWDSFKVSSYPYDWTQFMPTQAPFRWAKTVNQSHGHIPWGSKDLQFSGPWWQLQDNELSVKDKPKNDNDNSNNFLYKSSDCCIKTAATDLLTMSQKSFFESRTAETSRLVHPFVFLSWLCRRSSASPNNGSIFKLGRAKDAERNKANLYLF